MSGTASPRQQRRWRKIAMLPDELDEFLTAERTCAVATVGADGGPHVSPVWFVWDGSAVWFSSLVRSQRWTNLIREPQVALLVEAGGDYAELRGVEMRGAAAPIGPVPHAGAPDAATARAEQLFADKYRSDGSPMDHDGRHAWMRVAPTKIVSWDFRKIPARAD